MSFALKIILSLTNSFLVYMYAVYQRKRKGNYTTSDGRKIRFEMEEFLRVLTEISSFAEHIYQTWGNTRTLEFQNMGLFNF